MVKIVQTLFLVIAANLLIACDIKIESTPTAPEPDPRQYLTLTNQFSAVETKNFIIYSRLSQTESEGWAQKLELFRYGLYKFFDYPDVNAGLDKVEFYLIDNKHIYDSFYTSEFAIGFYSDSIASPKIVIDISNRLIDETIIFHEYFHHFNKSAFEQKLPVWMNEGLAQYFSNFSYDESSEQITFGTGDISNYVSKASFEAYEKTIASLYEYPFTPGFYGEHSIKRANVFYSLSWAICDWLMDTQQGQAYFHDIMSSLDNGIPPPAILTYDTQNHVIEHLKSPQSLRQLNVSEFHSTVKQAATKTHISDDEIKQHWYYLLELDRAKISEDATAFLTHMSDPTSAKSVYAQLTAAVQAYKTNDISLFNDIIENIQATHPLNREAATLSAKIFFIHFARPTNKETSLRKYKALEKAGQNNTSLKTFFLARTGGTYYGDNEQKIYEELALSNALKRDPITALGTFDAHITMKKFEEADAMLKRAALWGPGRYSNIEKSLETLRYDLEAARKFHANNKD